MNKKIKKKRGKLDKDLKGIYFGQNNTNKPILINPWSASFTQNENFIFLGTPGHGMSFYNNQILLEASKKDCVVVDPKGDYIALDKVSLIERPKEVTDLNKSYNKK